LAQQARFSWLTTVGALWITACVVLGMMQVRIWKDMLTVVTNAIDNGYYQRGMMHFARGIENGDLKHPQEAIKDFTKAIEIKPDLKDAYKFRGSLYAQANQIDLAVKDLETYLAYDSTDVVTWNNMAMIYMRQNQLGKSLNAFTRTIELKPDAAISYQNRARIYQMMGNVEKANEDMQKAKELATAPK
jgi:tetratricopeptide (TPR) repeat protein